jgi:hypothetical protein
VAEKKPIEAAVREHILKYCAHLRDPAFGLDVAAEYLEQWVNGTLPAVPLLKVEARLATRSAGSV